MTKIPLHLRKKITLRLPPEIVKSFSQLSKISGVGKADLLREWIKTDTGQLSFNQVPIGKHRIAYSLTISITDHQELIGVAKKLQLSVNNYLTRLLQKKLRNSYQLNSQSLTIENQREVFNKIWDCGQLNVIHHDFLEKYNILTNEQKLKLLRAEMESGRFSTAKEILNIFQRDAINENNEWAMMNSLRYEVFYLIHQKRDFDQAKALIDKAWQYGLKTKDRTLLGCMSLKKAEIAVFQSQMAEVNQYLQVAADYLDPITHPYYFISAKLATVKHALRQSKYQDVVVQLQRVEQLLTEYPNEFLVSQFLTQKGVFHYGQKNYDVAYQYLTKGLNLAEKNNSTWMEVYNHQLLGKVRLAQKKYDTAEKHFAASHKFDTAIRPHFNLGRPLLFTSLLRAQVNYGYAMNTVQTIRSNSLKIVEPAVLDYVAATIKYLYAGQKTEVEKGRSELRKLTVIGDYQSIRNAALMTLKNKEPEPFF